MNFDELIESHKNFGTSKNDIIKRREFENILENVVIAPWWSHNIFQNFSKEIIQVGESIFNIIGEDFQFSFIEIKNIGAPAILENVLPLGLTNCKRIIFIGSAGALVETIKIGDLVIPQYSFSGIGACRYLNKNLEDDFEKKCYPNKNLTNELIDIIHQHFSSYKCHYVANYSVDTIFAQFPHIDHFLNLGAKTIEMETSALFKCCDMIGIESSAIFSISDNTIKNKSLYSGRTAEEKVLRHKMRDEIIPQIVIELLKKFN